MAEDADLAALRWQEAIDADQVDWSGFTAWLEADPAHREAFDAVSQIDRMLKRHGFTAEARAAHPRHDRPVRNDFRNEAPIGNDHRPNRFAPGSSRYWTAKPM